MLITEFEAPDLEFAWADDRESDPEKAASVAQVYVTNGIKTIESLPLHGRLRAPFAFQTMEMKPMKLYAAITKLDHEKRMVFGYASTEALDSQGEIVRKEAIEAALPDYMRFANIREMHQPSAVGVAKEAEIDDKGLYLAARIVDDEAWRKVTEGVYKGFSIGGRVTQRDLAQKHVITGVELLEISLVDRPANPEAVIELYKVATRPAPLLGKGMAGVQSLAGLLDAIDRLCAEVEAEAAFEGDGGTMPEKLRVWREDGAALLRAMVKEETDELIAESEDEPGDDALMAPVKPALARAETLAKVGARHSKADLARVQQLHDVAVDLGAACPGAAKRDAAEPLRQQIAELAKRLEIIEAQPLPGKGALKAVAIAKEQDAGTVPHGETLDGFVARLAGLSAEKRAHELTKLALRLPQSLPR